MRDGVSDMHCMSDLYLAEELKEEYDSKKEVSIYVHEVEIIVNRITRIFNSMGAEIKLFDKETDWEQIRSENWRRGVDFNDAEAYLAKFKDIPALFFLIEFKNPN